MSVQSGPSKGSHKETERAVKRGKPNQVVNGSTHEKRKRGRTGGRADAATVIYVPSIFLGSEVLDFFKQLAVLQMKRYLLRSRILLSTIQLRIVFQKSFTKNCSFCFSLVFSKFLCCLKFEYLRREFEAHIKNNKLIFRDRFDLFNSHLLPNL